MDDDSIKRIYERLNNISEKTNTISREVGETKVAVESIDSNYREIKKLVEANAESCRDLIEKHNIRLNVIEKYFAQLKVAGIIIGGVITIICSVIVAWFAFLTFFK
jgi:t-SNARE complex subunit (syntaxin)